MRVARQIVAEQIDAAREKIDDRERELHAELLFPGRERPQNDWFQPHAGVLDDFCDFGIECMHGPFPYLSVGDDAIVPITEGSRPRRSMGIGRGTRLNQGFFKATQASVQASLTLDNGDFRGWRGAVECPQRLTNREF